MEGNLYDFVKDVFVAASQGTNGSYVIHLGFTDLVLYMFEGIDAPDGGHVWLNSDKDSVACMHMPRIDHGGQYVNEVRTVLTVRRGNEYEWPIELSISDQMCNGEYGLYASFVYPAHPPIGFRQDVFDTLRRMLIDAMTKHKEADNDET